MITVKVYLCTGVVLRRRFFDEDEAEEYAACLCWQDNVEKVRVHKPN